MVGSKDAKVKFGRQNRAGYCIWWILPVANDDIGMFCGCDQSQHSSNDGSIGVTLKCFRIAEVDAKYQDSAFRSLPKECLVATTLDGIGLKLCQTA